MKILLSLCIIFQCKVTELPWVVTRQPLSTSCDPESSESHWAWLWYWSRRSYGDTSYKDYAVEAFLLATSFNSFFVTHDENTILEFLVSRYVVTFRSQEIYLISFLSTFFSGYPQHWILWYFSFLSYVRRDSPKSNKKQRKCWFLKGYTELTKRMRYVSWNLPLEGVQVIGRRKYRIRKGVSQFSRENEKDWEYWLTLAL